MIITVLYKLFRRTHMQRNLKAFCVSTTCT